MTEIPAWAATKSNIVAIWDGTPSKPLSYFYDRKRALTYCGCTETQFDAFVDAGLFPKKMPESEFWLKAHLDKAIAWLDVLTNSRVVAYEQVYFISCEQFIKIGFSGSARKRMADLQASTPFELRLIGLIPGGEFVEGRLHNIFDDHRHRGEWFRSSPALLAYIDWIKGRLP